MKKTCGTDCHKYDVSPVIGVVAEEGLRPLVPLPPLLYERGRTNGVARSWGSMSAPEYAEDGFLPFAAA